MPSLGRPAFGPGKTLKGFGPALRLASYNIHECVGTDGVCDPTRVAAVLSEVDASVVGLQEVASQAGPGTPARQLEHLAEATGMHPVYGPTLRRRGGQYGNGLLTGLPVDEVRRHDLSVPGREPRGALEVRLAAGGICLRVVVTHLGLRRRERGVQARALWAIVRPRAPTEMVALLADVNEWWPWGAALRLLRRGLGPEQAPATFPSRLPLLALDRVWVSPAATLARVWTHRTPLARRASDHLPVLASLPLSPPVVDRRSPPNPCPGGEPCR